MKIWKYQQHSDNLSLTNSSITLYVPIQDKFFTVLQLQVTWKDTCDTNIRRFKQENCKTKTPLLNACLLSHIHILTVDDWKKVVWRNENKFNLFHSDGRGKVSEKFILQ